MQTEARARGNFIGALGDVSRRLQTEAQQVSRLSAAPNQTNMQAESAYRATENLIKNRNVV